MANRSSRYHKMEQGMTCALVSDTALFVLYLVMSGLGIIWGKIAAAVLVLLLSAAILGYLHLTQELLKRRSMWMSVAAAAIALCTLVSLIFNFPRPKYTLPDKPAVSDCLISDNSSAVTP